MNLLYYLIIAIIAIIITIFFMKSKKYGKNKIIIALIGMTLALTILVFPLYGDNNFVSQIVFSILYAAQVIFLNQDFELINAIETNTLVNEIYIVLIYLLFLLEPLTTATAILAFLGNRLSKIKMFLSRNKEAFVFSEINSKTLTIAKTQNKDQRKLIIFFDNQEKQEQYQKEINQLKAIVLEQKVTDLNLKNKKITYYLFSDDEENNLNDALELLNQKKEKSRIKIYVLNHTEEARVILDSCPKNGIRLELVNEIERMVYQQISEQPIYQNAIDHQISILIVGCGKVGIEFLKAATWCGQLINHQLKINVIDLKAEEIKEKLNVTCPELCNHYSYHFIQADLYSEKAMKELDALKQENINYILVALETEEKNIDAAIFLRKYFLAQDTVSYTRMPSINLWIENDDKKIQIDSLKHDNSINSYHFNSFGSIRDMYGEHSIVLSEIERLAMQVHGVYDPEDISNNLARFYELEYNKKSSRAVAVHLKYKLYSVLKDVYVGNLEEDLKNNLENVFKQYREVIKDPKIEQALIKNEHDRWNAYVRTEGFKSIKKEEVKKYMDFTKNTKHFLAKLHPAIVAYEELEEVERYLQKDFKTADIQIIHNLEKILKKEID